MKVLQVNSVYPVGSTGRIVKDLHIQLMTDGHGSVVCYGRGARVQERNVHKIAPEFIMKMQSLQSKLTGHAYAGCPYSTRSLLTIIEKERPDVVHLHCINAYIVNIYRLLGHLKSIGISTVLTLHAEFMYTAGCGHALGCERWKTGCGRCPQKGSGRPSSKVFDRSSQEWRMMQRAYDGFGCIEIVAVSEWLRNRARQSPFYKDKHIEVVLNGIDTRNVFTPKDASGLRKSLRLSGEKVVLHVTSSFTNPLKGGRYVIELARRLGSRGIRLVVVGFNGDRRVLPSNVVPIPATRSQRDLAAFYAMADLTVLTSARETFSMVCAESLSCGTPVVGFEAGAPEAISLKPYSEFVEQGNIDALVASVERWLDKKQEFGDAISRQAAVVYSREAMYEKYLDIYKRCCK